VMRMYVWLRCWLGRHEWVTWLDGNRPEDRTWGFTKRVCPDCKAVELAPGYFP